MSSKDLGNMNNLEDVDFHISDMQFETMALAVGFWQTRDIVWSDWSADDVDKYLEFHRCANRDVEMNDGTTAWTSLCLGGEGWAACRGNNTGQTSWAEPMYRVLLLHTHTVCPPPR